MEAGGAAGAAFNPEVIAIDGPTPDVEYLAREVESAQAGVDGAQRKIDKANADLDAAHEAFELAEADHARALGALNAAKGI